MKAKRRRSPRFPVSRGRQGKRADIGVFVRSSWEANYARYLNLLKSLGVIGKWEYEPVRFEFPDIKRGTTSYLPDFRVTFTDGHVEYHEVKGYWTAKAKTAVRRFHKRYPEHALVVIDRAGYKKIEGEFKKRIENWE